LKKLIDPKESDAKHPIGLLKKACHSKPPVLGVLGIVYLDPTEPSAKKEIGYDFLKIIL
jgi:hypothetical protein